MAIRVFNHNRLVINETHLRLRGESREAFTRLKARVR